MMSLWEAGADDYYPDPDSSGASFWGASTDITDWVFGDGVSAVDAEARVVIRAILIPNTTTGNAVIVLKAGDGTVVMSWTAQTTVADGNLLGPDGVVVPKGFYVTVASGDASLLVVYDAV